MHPAPGLLPTFVGVIQLEDIGVLGVVRQLHHPAHHGDFFAGCGFVLGKNNSITRRPMPLTPGGSRAGPGKVPSRPSPLPPAHTTRSPSMESPLLGLTCFLSVPRKDLAP